ncbi:amino acid deaminase, partial [Jiangella anatolica]
GTRGPADVDAVRSAIDRAPNVRLTGVAGYEGSVAGDRTPPSLSAVTAYLESVREAGAAVASDVDGEVVLSAGGSMFYDVVADVLGGAGRVILRSGCYVTHDSGMFHRNSPLDGPDAPARLRAALTVWGTVVSAPEPGRAFLDVGRRDASFDQGLPIPLAVLPRGSSSVLPLEGAEVTALNDQHAFLAVPPDAKVAVGDRVQLGISHPCTTFDKWRSIPLTSPDGSVTDVVETCF